MFILISIVFSLVFLQNYTTAVRTVILSIFIDKKNPDEDLKTFPESLDELRDALMKKDQ